MFSRFQPVKTKNLFPRRGKWLLLLVTVLLFALVTTTAAQEDVSEDPADIPVPDPIMINRSYSPEGITEQWTFFTNNDAFISSRFPDTRYGLDPSLRIGYSDSFQAMRMLFKYNLTTIPTDSIVNWATIGFLQTASNPVNDSDMGFRAQEMRSDWQESSVTWNNANWLGGTELGLGNITSANGWKTRDVTPIAREWVKDPSNNFGVILTGHEGTDPARSRTFQSRQAANPPTLTVNFNASCDTTPPTAWVEALPTWSQESFTVSWTGTDSAPTNCQPTGIASYDVQFSTNGGASWTTWKDHTTSTSDTFTGASNGQQIWFRARARDNAGNQQAWTGAQTQTRIDTINPNATMNALPGYTMGTSIPTSWTGSDNAGGSGIATYDVQVREDEGDWVNWLTGTTATSATLTGARAGSTYGFRARATDVAGNVQPWSEDAQTSTTVVNHPVAVVLPFDPNIIRPTDPVTTSFTVDWEGLTVSGVTISKYELQYKFNNGPWTFWASFNAPQRSAEFTDLEDHDGTYFFEARALTNAIDVEDEQFNDVSEALKVVDLEPPFYRPVGYMPLISKDGE